MAPAAGADFFAFFLAFFSFTDTFFPLFCFLGDLSAIGYTRGPP